MNSDKKCNGEKFKNVEFKTCVIFECWCKSGYFCVENVGCFSEVTAWENIWDSRN